jgi:exodeoxyribonuclease X
MKNLIFIDTETTGVDAEDRLVELGYKIGQEVKSELFRAPPPVKLQAMAVNNITNRMLANKPLFQDTDMYREALGLIPNNIVVAHNAIFDIGMLAKENIEVVDHICTLKVAHFVDVDCKFEKHNLSYLRYFYDIEIDAHAHSASDDVRILEAVFQKLYSQLANMMNMEQQPEILGYESVINKMIEISKNPTMFRKFTFGKYEGQFIKDVANGGHDGKGRSWMKWLLEQKMSAPFGTENDWIYTLNYYLN